jgi:putative DNA primase/helicase
MTENNPQVSKGTGNDDQSSLTDNASSLGASVIARLLQGESPDLLPLSNLDEPWRSIAQAVAVADDRSAAYSQALTSLDGQGDAIQAEVTRAAELLWTDPGTETETIPAALDDVEIWLPVEQVLDALSRSETGDAELLAALYADRIVYDHAQGTWYLWNGQHWEKDRCKFVVRLVADGLAAQYLHAAAELRRTASGAADDVIAELLARAHGLRFRSKINNILTLATSQPSLALNGEEWDQDPYLLGVANGTLSLRDASFRPGHPRDYIRTVAPTPWEGLDASAPRWERFLQDIFADDESIIGFVRRLLGYGVTGLSTEHIVAVLWGIGRNGKDTLLETLANVLGHDLASPVGAEVLVSGGRRPNAATPHIYALQGLRLAWVSETNEGAELNAGQVKMLCGGGTVVARPLYGQPVRFQPQHLLMLVTNFRPVASPDDYALWERLRLIPFTESFVDDPDPHIETEHQRDPDLKETLKREAPGILAWLVHGCLTWQEQGLDPPATVMAATREYREEQDVIGQFIEECCVVSPGSEAGAQELYDWYYKWASDYRLRPMGTKDFGMRMVKRFEREDRRTGRVYIGIGLRTRSVPPL